MLCSNTVNMYGIIKTKIHNKNQPVKLTRSGETTNIQHLDYSKSITNLLYPDYSQSNGI